jgi:hypothetical protein
VPAQLLGDWYEFLPTSTFNAISSYPCPPNPTAANCFFQVALTATTFHLSSTALGGTQSGGQGNVVVNHSEIDFFNGICDGVGRYKWSIAGGVLRFTLISDPCTRSEVLTDQSWSRTH